MPQEKIDPTPTSTSPFKVEGLTTRYISKKGEILNKVDYETGEVEPWERIEKKELRMHDSLTYTKVFKEGQSTFLKLNGVAAIKIFGFIIYNARVNWDSIYLDPKHICPWANISRSVFYKGIAELVQQQVIRKREGSKIEYWINPNKIYNGDRIKLHKYNQRHEIE